MSIDGPFATAYIAVTHDIVGHPLALVAAVDGDSCVTATDSVDLQLADIAFVVEVEVPIGCGNVGEEEGGDEDERTHFDCGRLASESRSDAIMSVDSDTNLDV